jgi:hypothetical protein
MSEKKRKICALIESYINDFRGVAISEFYGEGTKVKILNLDYTTRGVFVLVEAKIILGEIISEEVMERALVDYVIQDALVYFFPEQPINVMITWE